MEGVCFAQPAVVIKKRRGYCLPVFHKGLHFGHITNNIEGEKLWKIKGTAEISTLSNSSKANSKQEIWIQGQSKGITTFEERLRSFHRFQIEPLFVYIVCFPIVNLLRGSLYSVYKWKAFEVRLYRSFWAFGVPHNLVVG